MRLFRKPNNVEFGKSCECCKHFFDDGDELPEFPIFTSCIAFPNGIPDEVYNNGHFEPRADLGQKNDVVFELENYDYSHKEREATRESIMAELRKQKADV